MGTLFNDDDVLVCQQVCHNSVEITHDKEDMMEQVWDILQGGGDGERGCADVDFTSSSLNIDGGKTYTAIRQQKDCKFDKPDWFFIIEMHNAVLFSSSISDTMVSVFEKCFTAYNAGDKDTFDECRRELTTCCYRDHWRICRHSSIPNGIRIVFERKSLDIATPPFASYERFVRYGFGVKAMYWCYDSDDNSGAWEDLEHIHMDTDLVGYFDVKHF